MDLTFTQLTKVVGAVIEGRRVPMITSKPGVGKSAVFQYLAKLYNLFPIDIRLTTYDTVSLNGFPSVDELANRSTFVPMGIIPIAGRDAIPKGYDGWLVNFDELPDCTPTMQSAAYKIILDRFVGDHKIHDNVLMMACGNGVNHGGAAHRVTAPMKSRLVHFGMASHVVGWINWAIPAGIDYRIVSFLRERPELLNNFDPATVSGVITFACERTYEILSDVAGPIDVWDSEVFPILAGAIGDAAATELYNYVNVFAHLPSIDDVIKSPTSADIPNEPSSKYAMVGKLVGFMDKNNFSQFMTYINRYPSEYAMNFARNALRKDRTLKNHPQIQKLVSQSAINFDVI